MPRAHAKGALPRGANLRFARYASGPHAQSLLWKMPVRAASKCEGRTSRSWKSGGGPPFKAMQLFPSFFGGSQAMVR